MGGVGELEGGADQGGRASGVIRCEQCGRISAEPERGWEALHELDADGRLVLVVLCWDCAEAARHPGV
jgi:hypothetical protein